MHRPFEVQSRRMLGNGEDAHPLWYVTEPVTTQMAALRSNPSGSGLFAATSPAPQSAAKMQAAIGTATPSEAP
jgi:NAD dependent epimerase/dehydratase family enzyme